ncbi:MAG: hypothetical protein R3C28_25010 [Pirellulaceae bacterium]
MKSLGLIVVFAFGMAASVEAGVCTEYSAAPGASGREFNFVVSKAQSHSYFMNGGVLPAGSVGFGRMSAKSNRMASSNGAGGANRFGGMTSMNGGTFRRVRTQSSTPAAGSGGGASQGGAGSRPSIGGGPGNPAGPGNPPAAGGPGSVGGSVKSGGGAGPIGGGAAAVPEPSSLGIWCVALVGLYGLSRRFAA